MSAIDTCILTLSVTVDYFSYNKTDKFQRDITSKTHLYYKLQILITCILNSRESIPLDKLMGENILLFALKRRRYYPSGYRSEAERQEIENAVKRNKNIQYQIVKMLLQLDFKLISPNNILILTHTYNIDIVKLLVEYGININRL